MPRNLPITFVLVFGIGVLVTAAIVLVFLASFQVARLNTVELTRDKAELLMERMIERIEQHLIPVEFQIETVASLLVTRDIDLQDDRALGHVLLASLAATPQVSGMVFVWPDGTLVRAARNHPDMPIERLDWSDNPAFRQLIETARPAEQPYWGDLFFAETTGLTYINVRLPVRRNGELLGVLIAGVSIRELSEFLGDISTELTDNPFINAFILYGRDHVLAHPLFAWGFPGLSDAEPLPSITGFSDPVISAMWTADDIAPVEPEFLGNFQAHTFSLGAQVYIALYREVEVPMERPWIIGTYVQLGDIAPQFRRLLWIPLVVAGVLVTALLLAWLMGRHVSRPLKALAGAAVRIRGFELDAVPALSPSRLRELNEATGAFNAMVAGLRSFERYVPRTLVRRLIRTSDHGDMASDERTITVLFTDMVGFTELAESLSARDVAEFLNEHFSLIGECVEAEGGTIDKFIGDALMAFWGAPEPQEDGPRRACRAALAMSSAIEAENAKRRAAGLAPIRLRVGIHTGPVVVGNIGMAGRINYTIVGDTVNACQRLEDLGKQIGDAADVTILTSARTVAELDDGFEVRPVGDFTVKGREETLAVYRLLPPTTAIPSDS